ncbi:MAG: TRAP transporter small permease [Desulfovibrionaceae bacterium]
MNFIAALTRRLDIVSRAVSNFLAVLAGVVLVGMMLLACTNMVLRATPYGSVKGTVELVGFCGAVLTAFALAYSQRMKGHTFVGILSRRFPRPVRKGMEAFQQLVSCGFFIWCGVETSAWASSLVRTGELSETLHMVYHPFVFAAALGCLSMAFVLFVDFLKTMVSEDIA